MLVPVEEIERHPRNPRRGVVSEIKKSLERFGQVRPVLTDGQRIVAGNHTYLAALELGWTHIAAIKHEFASEEEARAYLLADNRLPELGGYDRTQLMSLLEELSEFGSWAGTGYVPDDLADLRAMYELAATPPPSSEPVPFGDLREVVLLYSVEEYEQLGVYLRVLRTEYGIEGTVETVLRAVSEEAKRVSDGGA
jgi:ParB-like nuclease family protein